MITDADIKKLKGHFASALDMEIVKQKLVNLEQGSARIESLAERMLVAADRMSGRVGVLESENKFGAVTVERHTRQIEALAAHTGTKLPQ